MTGLLDAILAGQIDRPFALIARSTGSGAPRVIDVVAGPVRHVDRIENVSRLADGCGAIAGVAAHRQLFIVPYRQIGQSGYAHHDDGEPLCVMEIDTVERHAPDVLLARLPQCRIDLDDAGFDIDDARYAAMARAIIDDEIATGEGANFVLSRTYRGRIEGYSQAHALSIYRALLALESGAYWTFLIHIAGRSWIGASPEQQVTLAAGTATMNPISGTYRYPPSGPTIEGLVDFLNDPKEIDELYMVVDEELKTMCRLCPGDVRLRGPFLKEMSSLAHTEYLIDGRTDVSAALLLQGTLPAPTVTGSPVRNACRVIAKHEPQGRGYYAGAAALIGIDDEGRECLDSAILIRTLTIDERGEVRLPVGATIVRHSDPAQEAAETRAKATAFLRVFEGLRGRSLRSDPRVTAALGTRNARIADYWHGTTAGPARSGGTAPSLLVVDADDAFTQMIAHQLGRMGLSTTMRSARDLDPARDLPSADLVLLGPGPGDPRDMANPCVRALNDAVDHLLGSDRPFLAICLSHQVLCARLGLTLQRHDVPRQGVQRTIDFFGDPVTVGFYNTFSAVSADGEIATAAGGQVSLAREATTSEVFGARGRRFSSMQFHPESILSLQGHALMKAEVARLLA